MDRSDVGVGGVKNGGGSGSEGMADEVTDGPVSTAFPFT